ncbi:MAG: pseudouridine synthase [Pseudomonadales bacterium]|nr:pseudouridine synthase [Pseudomonadales bacterium]MAP76237.1 pseudouridine synthase [Pseudomonadales bacterium]
MSAATGQALLNALGELEQVLRELGLWSQTAPEDWRLESQEPFCVDTLAFEHWLQWVLIPQITMLIEQGRPLPGECRLHPMGEQVFAHLGRRRESLLAALISIDHLAARWAEAVRQS